MYCSNCGKEIQNNAVACPYCGTATGIQQQPNYYSQPQQPIQPPYQQQYRQAGFQDSDIVTNSKILGILSIVLGIFIPLAGWICGGIGLSKAKKCMPSPDQATAKKLNTIGLILTSCLFAVYIICYIIIIARAYGMYF